MGKHIIYSFGDESTADCWLISLIPTHAASSSAVSSLRSLPYSSLLRVLERGAGDAFLGDEMLCSSLQRTGSEPMNHFET